MVSDCCKRMWGANIGVNTGAGRPSNPGAYIVNEALITNTATGPHVRQEKG